MRVQIPIPVNYIFTADNIVENTQDHVLPSGVLTFKDLGVEPKKVTEGFPIEHLRYYRVGGYDFGGQPLTHCSQVIEGILSFFVMAWLIHRCSQLPSGLGSIQVRHAGYLEVSLLSIHRQVQERLAGVKRRSETSQCMCNGAGTTSTTSSTGGAGYGGAGSME